MEKYGGTGHNGYGQLALGNTTNTTTIKQATDAEGNYITDAKHIVAGGYSTYISRNKDAEGNNQGMYVAGYNGYGQLFTQDTIQRNYATAVEADKYILTMALINNTYQAGAIADEKGIVYTVGYNVNGEMGDETTTSKINPTSISDASLDVENQRIILNLDSQNNTEQIQAATDLGFNLLYTEVTGEQLTFKSLDENIATVDNQGLVIAQSYGTTKVEVTTNKLPNKVLVTVEVLRKDDIATPKVVSGQNFTVALKADGTVWTWGYNNYGQLGTGDTSNRYKPTKINIENVIDISAGDNHVLLLTKDGKVYSFGSNSYGQLGRTGETTEPIEIPGLEGISQIVASTYNSMALTKQGKLYTWGYNGYGQLGDGTTSTRTEPTIIKLKEITKIAGKNQTSVAIDTNGNLYTWGYNGYGQLGTGDRNSLYLPTVVSSLNNIVDVAIENNTIIALNSNGEVYASGYNYYGNLGNNTTSNRYTFDKVIESYNTITTGTGEDETTTQEPVYLSNVKMIEAGNEYAIATKNDGTAVVWGYNGSGQFANGNKNNILIASELKYSAEGDKIDQIFDVAAAQGTITVALTDGTVWTAGKNNYGQMGDSSIVDKQEFTCISNSRILINETPIRINGINKTKDVSAIMVAGFNLLYNTVSDYEFKYSIKNSQIATIDENTGTITSVKKGKTQATVTDTVSGKSTTVDVYVLGDDDITFPQIESCNYATVTLKSNGQVWNYGNNANGQLGTGDTNNRAIPTYTGIDNIVQIALGNTHAIAVDADGHVFTWGTNTYGQLGDGTQETSYTKIQVKSPDGEGVLEDIVAVAAGNGYSLALDKNGYVYSWGYNGYGQLGIGNTTQKLLPVLVDSLEKITKIEASNSSSFAIDSDNKLWVAGYNGYGNLGDGTTQTKLTFTQNNLIEDVAEVSASQTNSTIALLLDGTVWGFGNNSNNALTNVAGAVPQQIIGENGCLEGITSINTGYNTGYAITSEEKVVAWGLNNYAQLATGDKTTQTVAKYMKDKDGNDFTDAMIVSGGIYNTEIAKNDGTVWSIGYNYYGELGDGSVVSQSALECISTQYIKVPEREVILKLSNPNYQINPETVYGFNLLYDVAINNGFKYESSNPEVATVDVNTGKVTAVGLGRTYITIDNGENSSRVVVDVIGEDKKTVEKVATGYDHSLALKQDGTIWAWGDNTYGEIGKGVANSTKATEPTQIEKGVYSQTSEETAEDGSIITTTTQVEQELNNIVDIAAGYYYNLALDQEGKVWAWGYNYYGQLGDNTTTNKYIPTRIDGLENIKKVYINGNTSIAINDNGEVYVWGYGFSKTPTKINFYNKVVSATGKIMLAEDGTVWNLSASPSKIAELSNIVEISSEDNYYAAIDAKGYVWAWGYNGYGQLGQGNTTNSSVPIKVQIEKTQTNDDGEEIIVKEPIQDIIEITCGNDNIIMTNKDGEVYSCGYSGYGQLGTGEYVNVITLPTKAINVDNIKLTSSYAYHSVISDTAGFVYTAGRNINGQLGDGTFYQRNVFEVIGDTYVNVSSNVVTLEVNGTEKITASLENKFNLINDVVDNTNITYQSLNEDIATITSDGTITGKQIGKAEIIATHTITNKTAIIFVNVVPDGKVAVPEVEIGDIHSVALKADGTVWTWGTNDNGQLGIGDNNAKTTPVKVTGIENVIDISVGYYDTVCVTSDGTVWSFGYNGYGQLGDGTSSNRKIPVHVIKADGTELKNIVKVAAGKYRTVALDSDGNVWIWGYGYSSTATKLTSLENIIDISANYAVNQEGKVFKIEDAYQIQADSVIRVSEGYDHVLFLTKDGKGYGLGENTKGQLGQGTSQKCDTPELIKSTLGTGELTDIKELKAGKEFSMALLKNGDTYVWGSNENYKLATTQETNQTLPNKNEEIKNAIFIETGINNGAIIDEEGFVYTWGLGTYGTLGNKLYNTVSTPVLVGRADVGLDTNNITIHKGEEHQITVTNKTFNVLKEVEDNSEMKYVSGNNQIASVTSSGLVTGVKEGTTTIVVNKVGTDYSSIAQVTVLPDGVDIEPMALTCGSHTVVLKSNGTVWSYGVNSSYELGNGSSTSTDMPVQVKFPTGTVIKQIAVGNTHNLALDTEGNVWGWGSNSNYALGTTSSTPVKLGLTNIKKIAANNDQSMALTEDGYVYVWGLNANGELGTRTYTTVTTPTLLPYISDILDISLGKNHSILLTTSGKVLTSGLNTYGQTAKESGKSNTFEEIKLSELIGQIAAGDNHSVLLTTSGEIYTFGYNVGGQLGTGNKEIQSTPKKISGINNIMKISAGKNHTIILDSNRKLYSAGSNKQGELGIGNNEDKVLFTLIDTVDDMMSISCGNTYSVAIRYDGDVYGWGDYYHGTQSVKTKTNSRIPVKIGNDSSYVNEPEITINVNGTKQIDITPRYIFNVFKENEISEDFNFETINENIATIDSEGIVTGVKVGTTWVKAIEADTLKENVVMVRVIEEGQKYAPQVAGGENYATVLKADGTIWGFGYNSDGQLGNDRLVPTNIPNKANVLATYKKVVTGKSFTMALREDGTVWAWGDNAYGVLGQGNRASAKKPIQVQGLANIVNIAAGDNHAVAIDSMGNVYTWGLNSSGQLGNGQTKTVTMPERINAIENQIISISAGGNMTSFVDSKGNVYVFGDNSNEQIAKLTYNYDIDGQIIEPATNLYYAQPQLVVNIQNAVKSDCTGKEILVIKTDGSVQKISKYAKEENAQIEEIASSDMVDISSTNSNIMILDKYGNMYTYGNNECGQAGIGYTSDSNVSLQKITTIDKTFMVIGTGYNNNYSIDTEGFVYVAGTNSYGQLGNSTYEDSYIFTLVGDRNFKIIPEARSMTQPEEETVTIETNIFNVFNNNTKQLTDYDWSSSDINVATVEDGVITAQDMGETTITATDKVTGATSTAIRVVEPLDEQRIASIRVNGVEAKLIGEKKYEVTVVPNKEGAGTLVITTNDETDSISIDEGTTYVTGTLLESVLLDTNPKEVQIKVKTTNDKIVDYILIINSLSENVGLQSVTVNDIEATPVGATDYEIIIGNDITKPEVKAIAYDSNAKVSIDGAIAEVNTSTRTVDMTTRIKRVIPIQVTAESGAQVEYTLTIYKEDALTELESLTVNDIPATQVNKDTYKVIIDADLETSEICAESVYSSAEVNINNLGPEVNISKRVVATVGNYTIVKIYVTARENEREYTLIISKAGTEDELGLFSVTVNGTLITPVGNVYDAYIYDAYTAENATSVEVIATTVYENDLVSIGDNSAKVHIATETVAVSDDITTYTITVTDPDDSENKKEYTLNIKKPSSDTTLKSITVGNSKFAQEAKKLEGTNIYEVSIPEEYNVVDVIAITNYELAYVSVDNNVYEKNTTTQEVSIINEPTLVTVAVKAQNGSIEEYVLKIYYKDSNVNLSKVTVNGNEATLSTTEENTYEYTLNIDTDIVNIGAIAEEIKSYVKINTYEQEQSATYRDVEMTGKSIETYITVTSESGKSKQYKLIIYAIPDNVKLLSVKVNGKEAEAVPTNKYVSKVNKNDTSFELYVIPEDPNAKVQIETNPEVTGTASTTISKNADEVEVKIKVTAQDGTEETYTLVVGNQSDDCGLAMLKIDGEIIEADAQDGKYYVNKKYLTESVNVETIANNSFATVSINGLTPTLEKQTSNELVPNDENYITVKVTAEDGNSKEYTVVVRKLPNNTNAEIFIIMEENGEIVTNPITFNENNQATIKIGNNESVDLKGVLEDTEATISIDGNLAEKGTSTKTIVTTEKETTAIIEIIAQDGTQKNYTVTLVRNSSDNMLESLTATGIDSQDILKTSDNSYTIYMPDIMENLDLTAIARDKNATVQIDGQGYSTGNIATQTINVPTGTKTFEIIVKAEDGTENVYTITVVKVTDLGLTSVKIDDVECEKEDATYIGFVDANVTEVALSITPNNASALVSTQIGTDGSFTTPQANNIHIVNVPITSGQDTTVLIKVEDPNDSTRVKTYSVIIKEKSHDAEIELIQVDTKDAIDMITKYYAETTTDAVEANLYIKATDEYATVTIANVGDGIGSINKNITLDSGKITTVLITVTAQDGIVSNSYTLEIERKSNDTSCEITVDGLAPDEYDETTKTYTKYIERSVTEVTLAVQTTSDVATVEMLGNTATQTLSEQVEIENEITGVDVVVKAENGESVTYHVDIVKKSTDNTIATVKVDNQIVEEKDGKYSVTILDNGQSERDAQIEVIASNKNASVQIGDGAEWFTQTANSTVTYKDGNRVITLNINVKPQDSNTETLTKELEITLVSDDNSIKSVKNGDELITKYDASTHTFIEYIQKDVEEITLAIEANSIYTTLISGDTTSTGTLTISNINTKDQDEVIVKFTATSETGKTQEYTVVIYKMSDNANASHIYVDGEDIIDKFENTEEVPTYQLSIEKDKNTTQIRVDAENENANIRIGDTETGIGTVTRNITLDSNENSITVPIVITSQDGTVVKTYNIIFVRIPNNTNIQIVKVNNYKILENADGNYEITLKASEDTAKVDIILEDEFAKVTMGGNVGTGALTETVLLPEKGDTIKTITVTAEDGTVKTHKLIIHKQENDLTLKAVYLDGRAATKVEDTTYEIDVEKGKTLATIKAIANKSSEYVSISNNQMIITENTYVDYAISNGEVKIIVTAMFNNGTTEEVDQQKEYTLKIKEIEDPETLEDLKVTIKIDDEEITPDETGKYVKNVSGTTDNVVVWAGVSSTTSKVKIKDTNGETQYTNPSAEKNISLQTSTTEVTVTVQNGEGTTKEYTIIINKVVFITGKVITQAADQTNQTAIITLYRTDDLRSETDTSDPREIVKQININPDGTYKIEIVEGQYDMVVTKASYLEYRLTEIEAQLGGDIELEDIKILAGDIVQTGEIEIDDLVALNDNIGEVITDANEETKSIYDLNEDGIVNKLDRNILKKNYGKKAETVAWVNPNAVTTASVMSLEVEEVNADSTTIKTDFIIPMTCSYTITSEYGYRVHPTTGEYKKHTGIDLAGTHHTEILAVADGEVTYAGVQSGFGNCVEIKHIVNGETIYSFYAHLSRIDVKAGDAVKQGKIIGLEGGDPETDPNPGSSTGHHLHFEIRNASGYGNDVDPNNYIKF